MKGVSVIHRFTPQAVQDKYGLTPEQYPDFAALRGDPSDNLPSIPKVGEKTATKWIVQHGNLTNLLNNADTIKGVVGTNLRERIDQVKLNRQLTEMVKNLDLTHTPQNSNSNPSTPKPSPKTSTTSNSAPPSAPKSSKPAALPWTPPQHHHKPPPPSTP